MSLLVSIDESFKNWVHGLIPHSIPLSKVSGMFNHTCSKRERISSLLDLSDDGLSSLLLLGLLGLGVLGKDGFVLLNSLAGVLVTVDGLLLDEVLAADTGLSDKALNLGGLPEGLVSSLDFTSDNVLADIVLLFVKDEGLDDVVSALHAETVRSVDISDTLEVGVTLLDDSEEDGSKIGTADAATDGLSLALTNTAGNVTSATLLVEDAGSTVDKNTLLHLETLLVVTAGNSEDVALELVAHDLTIDLLTHSPVVEGTDVLFIVNFKLFLATSGRIANVKLERNGVRIHSDTL